MLISLYGCSLVKSLNWVTCNKRVLTSKSSSNSNFILKKVDTFIMCYYTKLYLQTKHLEASLHSFFFYHSLLWIMHAYLQ